MSLHHKGLSAGHLHKPQILGFHFHDHFLQHHEVFLGFPVQALILENAVFVHQRGDQAGIGDGPTLADVCMDGKGHIGILQ